MLAVEATAARLWGELTFGLTEGWWRFADPARRTAGPLLDLDAWQVRSAETGFALVTHAGRARRRPAPAGDPELGATASTAMPMTRAPLKTVPSDCASRGVYSACSESDTAGLQVTRLRVTRRRTS